MQDDDVGSSEGGDASMVTELVLSGETKERDGQCGP
jgi:hypothetical protein